MLKFLKSLSQKPKPVGESTAPAPIPKLGDYRIIEDGNGLFSVQSYEVNRGGYHWSGYHLSGYEKFSSLNAARETLAVRKAREEMDRLSYQIKKVYYE